MELHENNDNEFFKLVRKQRNINDSKITPMIFNDKVLTEEEQIKEGWAGYFEQLATPLQSDFFDQEHFDNTNRDITNIHEHAIESPSDSIPLFSSNEVRKTIMSFKNKKSPDEESISAEHMKYAGDKLISMITDIVNYIFQNVDIPNFLKSGIAYPILKNGKPKSDPNSYRKIVVTNSIGKIIDKLHLQHNENRVKDQQCKLQKGFTKGQMPLIAALILTELITEAKRSKSPLYVALMDARKAFDILWHSGLLRQMFNFGIKGNNWLFFQEWYTNVTSKINWNGSLSRPIQEQQGVRQGGVWSPTAYKIFINNLLQTFEKNQLGAYIGSIYCGSPTVADDVTLIADNPFELQTMLDVQTAYANKLRYLISEQKSTVLVFNDKKDNKWTINNKNINVSDSSVHLGITRDTISKTGNKEVAGERIITARRTVYALMGAGFHGLNGINPTVSAHLIRIYVLPRLLYGLDVINLSTSDIKNLDSFYLKLLKQIQHLPPRTANSASLLLLGRIPISGEIDKKILKTFGNIIRNDDSVEKEIAFRQLAMKSESQESWFVKVTDIAQKYELPCPHDLIRNPPTKEAWKALVNRTVDNYHITNLQKDAEDKSTLKFLNLGDTVSGKPHNIWTSCGTQPFAITMASMKVKIAVGTLLLQSHRSKFSKSHIDPTCKLCSRGPEDIIHFLVSCGTLNIVRDKYITELKTYLKNIRNFSQSVLDSLFSDEVTLAKLIIDCTTFHILSEEEIIRIETITRGLCYNLVQRRLKLLS